MNKSTKRRVKAAVGIAITLLILALVAINWYAAFLFPTSRVTVTASLDGKPIMGVAAYGATFAPDACYVHLPEVDRDLYHWILVRFATRGVSCGSGPHEGPLGLLLVHRDQMSGIRLTDGKTEDHWKVDFSGNEVRFSNERMNVVAIRR